MVEDIVGLHKMLSKKKILQLCIIIRGGLKKNDVLTFGLLVFLLFNRSPIG